MKNTFKKMQKVLSIMLVLVCLVSNIGCSTSSLWVHAREEATTGVFIDGVEIGSSGTGYTYAAGVLTITDLTVSGTTKVSDGESEIDARIYAKDDLRVVLTGSNTLTCGEYAIKCGGNLVIEGSGSLTVAGAGNGEISATSITINSGTVNGKSLRAVSDITVKGGETHAVGDESVKCANYTITDGKFHAETAAKDAAMEITSEMKIQGGESEFYGKVYGVAFGASGSFSMTAGILKAKGSSKALRGAEPMEFSENIQIFAGASEGSYEEKDAYTDEAYLFATKNGYMVTFDAMNGTASFAKKRVFLRGTYGTLPTAVRPGYTFEGWFTDKAAGDQVNATTMVTNANNHTLYAHWKGEKFTLTFDANGGSVSKTTTSVTVGLPYGELPTPTRLGFNFDGWFTAKEDGVQVTAGDIVDIANGKTLYAHWTEVFYKVSFDANGGHVDTESVMVNPGKPYGALPVATKDGYTMEGWYTAATGGLQIKETTVVTIVADQTLYAHWTGNKYTVVLDPNGGTLSSRTMTVKNGDRYGTIPTPTRNGYKFGGWFTDLTAGKEVKASDVVELYGDQTLYARWTANKYTITFNASGGKVTPATKSVEYGEIYGDLPTPTKDGCIFDGWFTAANGGVMVVPSSKVDITTNQTLYAHWTEIIYVVTLDPNGGKVTTTSINVTPTKTYGKLPVPTREGFKFLGWFTALSGGTEIKESTKVEISGNQTLYAHWEGEKVVVTLDPNGGTVNPDTKTVVAGEYYGELPTAEREGYYFDGWYTAGTGGSRVTSGSKVENGAPHTLYAHWRGMTFTVTFEANGGMVNVLTTRVVAGEKYGNMPTPTRTGYTFVGWYTEAKNGKKVTASTTVETIVDHTLYAHWKGNSYLITFDPNGGTVKTASKYVTYGNTYGDLPVTERRYYKFLGWFTAPSGGSKITVSTPVELLNDQTVFAHWSRIYVDDVSITSLKARKGGFKLTLYSASNVSGNQVRYTTYCTMKKCKTFTMGNVHSKLGLLSKKTYYVQVRSFRIDSTGKKVYGAWSTIKRVKTK